ncbi:MAG: hypothetical protein A2168_01010 [Planctomycetes bacterium RBG_13_50_24]|nr:MAG: hypothetical protein A2168_01010 [Planctomycetes bacterium RBG_13_50_24]
MKNNYHLTIRTMKKAKGNKGLLDQTRFESLEREKRRWLQTLSWKKAIQLEEKMLSSRLILEWLDNFTEDKPICLKKSLQNRGIK